MKDRLRNIFTSEGYQDVRYENLQITGIEFRGTQLKEISVSKKAGGHARGFYNGGWGHFSFTELDQVDDAIKTAIEEAKLVGTYRTNTYELAKAPLVEDVVRLNPEIDPRTVSLDEKRELLRTYNQLALDMPEIISTNASYYEQVSHKYFANNEGSYIDQEQIICGIKIQIIAKRGQNTQKVNIALGGTVDYKLLLSQNEKVIDTAKKAVALLDAEPVKAGNYTVIMDSDAAAVFIHEAFGHLSEADGVADSKQLQETMKLGRTIGQPILNVIDDGSLPGHPGSIDYDEDGVKAVKTYLIKDGILTGRLHSLDTAGKMGEELSGNSRAKDYSFAPVVRMSNIYIDSGESNFLEMLSTIEDGLYLVGAAGGQTSGITFTMATQYGYRIKNGKLGEMVRDIVVTCNLFDTMANISAIGNDLKFSRVGGCGKANQILITSGKGAPHIKIDSITIGGK